MVKVMAMVERKIEEERKKMVTFIAGVINATSDVKSKTEDPDYCEGGVATFIRK